MTTLLTILAITYFAYAITRAIILEARLRKLSKRNRAKQELAEKIQRKIDRAIEVNLHSIEEAVLGNKEEAQQLYEAGQLDSEEIDALIRKLESM